MVLPEVAGDDGVDVVVVERVGGTLFAEPERVALARKLAAALLHRVHSRGGGEADSALTGSVLSLGQQFDVFDDVYDGYSSS